MNAAFFEKNKKTRRKENTHLRRDSVGCVECRVQVRVLGINALFVCVSFTFPHWNFTHNSLQDVRRAPKKAKRAKTNVALPTTTVEFSAPHHSQTGKLQYFYRVVGVISGGIGFTAV